MNKEQFINDYILQAELHQRRYQMLHSALTAILASPCSIDNKEARNMRRIATLALGGVQGNPLEVDK